MKSPLIQFFVSFFLVLIVTLLVVWGLKGPFSGYIDISDFGNIGSIIGATLGIAVGLAGAFVAIKIASLANNIIQHERERDDFGFINNKLEAGLDPIIDVARKMSLLYAAALSGEEEKNQAISDITSDSNWREGDLNRKIGHELQYKRSIATGVEELADALEGVISNSYAMFLWRQTGSNKESYLERESIGDTGIRINVANDPGEIVLHLRMRAKGLQAQFNNANISDVAVPRLASNVAKKSSGEEFDNRAVRSFLDLGAEIWNLEVNNSIFNAGAAILLDISRCIPNSPEELKETVSMLFGEIIKSKHLETSPILSVTDKLGTRFWFGSSLDYTFSEFEKMDIAL